VDERSCRKFIGKDYAKIFGMTKNSENLRKDKELKIF
jgi:hypothetical protein